jgi:hypothetical protein
MIHPARGRFNSYMIRRGKRAGEIQKDHPQKEEVKKYLSLFIRLFLLFSESLCGREMIKAGKQMSQAE